MQEITGHTVLCGVMGDPIAHTLSPLIHNLLAEQMQLPMVYVPLHVRADALFDAVKGAYAMGVRGLNITVPHKQAVMECLVSVDDRAKAIGAVNTLVLTDEGYVGYNTDWTGLGRALDGEGISLKDKEVLLLGAGGAAKAVACLCGVRGASSVIIFNRTIERAREIAQMMSRQFPDTSFSSAALDDWRKLSGKGYIAIQTTSLGMTPNEGSAIIEEPAFYQMLSAAVDLVYRPFVTRYMRLAMDEGVKTCNGLCMLLYQAVEAFERMHGVSVPESVVEKVKEVLERKVVDEA